MKIKGKTIISWKLLIGLIMTYVGIYVILTMLPAADILRMSGHDVSSADFYYEADGAAWSVNIREEYLYFKRYRRFSVLLPANTMCMSDQGVYVPDSQYWEFDKWSDASVAECDGGYLMFDERGNITFKVVSGPEKQTDEEYFATFTTLSGNTYTFTAEIG